MYLNCHSHFSFRYGTLSVLDLLDLANTFRQKCIALTDINNTSACLNFIRLAKQNGVKPIVGVDFRNGVDQQFVLMAENNLGFEGINRYLSEFLHEETNISKRAKEIANTFVIYPFEKYKDEFISLKKNEYMGISIAALNQLAFSAWKNHRDQFVLLQAVSFRNKRDHNIHRLLRAIDNNCLLSKLPADEVASAKEKMQAASQLSGFAKDFPEISENTKKVMSRCSVDFTFKEEKKASTINNNKLFFTSEKAEDRKLLKDLCEKGLQYRFAQPAEREKVRARMTDELKLIFNQGFEAYFLVCWDMLRYARSRDFFYVGRGSGANSLVAYLLRITDVNPINLDLYFERFLNPYRTSPPDFDMDFSWKDRNAVIDYLFQKYGKEQQVALLATYNTFKKRSLYRELGKVFGLPKSEIDNISLNKSAAEENEYLSLVKKYAAYMEGLPSHLSIHAGGVIISERSVYCYSATSMPPKAYPLLQIDMVDAEDIGLYKYDVLSQRGLGKIKDALSLVKSRYKNVEIDLHNADQFLTDKKTINLLKKSEAIGCFYVESPAMRMLLKKLQVEHYLGLVAASSIIRPGVAQSGMMNSYILRAKGKDDHWEKHTPPILKKLMPETYGVMVYQEDVMKVAHHFGGLNLGEADLLRRGMSGKFRSKESFQMVRLKFFKNAVKKGYDKQMVAEVWRQIESFAGYAFSKGHSASYAVESFQSLYLKAHYPLEFMVAVINNGGGFYSREIYLHEAKKMGAVIQLPCINKSEWLTTLHGKNEIYLGFSTLKDIESRAVGYMLRERDQNGEFIDFDDFMSRGELSHQQISLLLQAEAFRFTALSKEELLWQLQLYVSSASHVKTQSSLFAVQSKEIQLPALDQNANEKFYKQIELFGFSLISGLEMLKNKILPDLTALDLADFVGKEVKLVAYLVTVKNSKTKYGERMQFGTFLDINGAWIDTVHFPPSVRNFPFRRKCCYLLCGRVMEEFGYLTIDVKQQFELDYQWNEAAKQNDYAS